MKKNMEDFRKAGVIEAIGDLDEDRGKALGLSRYIFIKYDAGGTQGFGGYVFKEHNKDWERAVARLFGCISLEQLVGYRCYALFDRKGWSQTIVGIMTEDGAKLTVKDFARKHFKSEIGNKSAAEKLRENLERETLDITVNVCSTRRHSSKLSTW